MVLGKSYKDRCNLERSQEVTSKSAELRCRHQLGQLREQDEEIVHALNVVRCATAAMSMLLTTVQCLLYQH